MDILVIHSFCVGFLEELGDPGGKKAGPNGTKSTDKRKQSKAEREKSNTKRKKSKAGWEKRQPILFASFLVCLSFLLDQCPFFNFCAGYVLSFFGLMLAHSLSRRSLDLFGCLCQ